MSNDPTPLSRIDLEHDGTVPTLRGWTHDNRQVIYVLSAAEAAAVVKRLAGYLAHVHREERDRTDETVAALTARPRHDGRPAA